MLSAAIFKMFLLFEIQLGETSVQFSVVEAFIRETYSGKTRITNVGLRISPATSMKMAVFWDVAPCSLVQIYRRAYCLDHQGIALERLREITETSIKEAGIPQRLLIFVVVVFVRNEKKYGDREKYSPCRNHR
jgi:hypothetical protein